MLFINFKTYPKATGKNAIHLVKILEEVSSQEEIKIIPVVGISDLDEAARISKLEIWVQKVDETISPEAILEDGASGTFLNHSQYSIDNSTIVRLVRECSKLNLKTMVFSKDLDELRQVIEAKPTYVAYEPPELIASPDTSVARSKPETIVEAAKIAKEAGVPLIVGAGIKESEDVKRSLELGAAGVAVSSAVVLADDPKKVVLNLARGLK